MFKRPFGPFTLLVLLGFFWSEAALCTSIPQPVEQAMQNWFTALRTGNTTTIGAMLGHHELSRTGPVLENSDYGNFLRERYRDARFEITGYRERADGSSLVEVKITLDPQESIYERYLLEATKGNRLKITKREPLI